MSYPKPRLADNWTEEDKQNYDLFKKQSIKFMQNKWGDNLLCVLEHTDEQYPHLHFYVVNKSKIASTPEMHPGYAENIRLENEAKAANKPVNKKEQVAAFKEAMRKFQDEFFNTVSIFCGLDRLGPKVQRLSRPEWKERKRVTKLLAKAFKKVKEQASDMNNQSNALNQSMLELEQQIASVIDMQGQLEEEHKAMENGLADIELAKFVRENYKDIVAKYTMQKMRKNNETAGNRLKI